MATGDTDLNDTIAAEDGDDTLNAGEGADAVDDDGDDENEAEDEAED